MVIKPGYFNAEMIAAAEGLPDRSGNEETLAPPAVDELKRIAGTTAGI